MPRTGRRAVWLTAIRVLVFAAVGLAQNTASIRGTATDPSGAAVVGAKVTVKGPLGIERTTQTNSVGYYELPALPPGTYGLPTPIPAFQTQHLKHLVSNVIRHS